MTRKRTWVKSGAAVDFAQGCDCVVGCVIVFITLPGNVSDEADMSDLRRMVLGADEFPLCNPGARS